MPTEGPGRKPVTASRRGVKRSLVHLLGRDGRWHGRVTVGIRDDGRTDRRHVSAKTKAAVTAMVRELEERRATSSLPRPSERWTVEGWLRHWLDEIAAPHVKVNTLSATGWP